jgi:malonyl-CoA O-methyltransferase
MVVEARRHRAWLRKQLFACGDMESLPLTTRSVGMVFSNLSLQWCTELDKVFEEFRRVLQPQGLLMFSTFGPDTLKELRASWTQVDGYIHVNAFIDMHDIGDALMRARFSGPVMDVEHFTLTYATLGQLMRELKAMGAHNVTAGRRTTLSGKGRLAALERAYERYRNPEGRLTATFEVVYGHAWARAAESVSGTAGSRTVSIPLSRIRRPPRGR